MRRALLLATTLLAPAAMCGARPAAAQTEPGGVATSVVAVAVESAGDSVDYRIDPGAGIRFFTPLSGRVGVRNGRAILPVTFGVPARAPARPLVAGTVRFQWNGGSASGEVSVRVAPLRGLQFEIIATDLYLVPGRTARVDYVLCNTGNATDTVTVRSSHAPIWDIGALPDGLVVAAGDSVTGILNVALRSEAATGVEHYINLTARGAGETEVRSQLRLISVSSIPGAGGLEALAELPSTVFVGASAGAAGKTGIALHSMGAVGETDVELELRLAPDGATPPAFQGMFAGPEARLTLRRGEWNALGGDVFFPSNLLLGSSLRGRGASVGWQSGDRAASAFAALPGARALGGGEDGHMVSGSYQLPAFGGSLEITGADVRRRLGPTGHRATGISALYETEFLASHEVDAEVALLYLDSDSAGSATGPALDASYRFRTATANASFHLRRIPATVSGRGGLGNELFVSGSIEPGRALRLTAWGFIQSQPFLERAIDPVQRGASLGARTVVAGLPIHLTGRLRQTEDPAAFRKDVEARSVELGLDWPLGALTLEADAEVGRTRADGQDDDLLRLRGGAALRGPDYSLWGSAAYTSGNLARDLVLLDIAGRARFATVDLDIGANAQLDQLRPFADEIRFWSAASFPVGDATRLRTGIDYLPFSTGGSRWRIALGVSREFDMPLPLERPPALHGVVFEDLDGDRERDADEPAIPGVELRSGFLVATSDQDGRFLFLDDGGGAVRPDPRSLPFGLLLPDDARLARSGFIAVPLVRTTGLELVLFLDRDGDDVKDEIEDFAERAVIRLTDRFGNLRSAVADTEGRARFASLPPGDYTISILPPGATRRRPVEIEITLPAGETVRRTIPLPLRDREIRIG